jgi:ankyrin repeat protein
MNDEKVTVSEGELVNAIEQNNISTVSSLISNGVVNVYDNAWPLHHAARQGRVEILSMLLDAGADIDAVDAGKNCACHIAIMNGQFDALKLLVERGANLSLNNSNGFSLISVASRGRTSEQIAIFLLDAGASLRRTSATDLMNLVTTVAIFKRIVARNVNVAALRSRCHSTICHYTAQNIRRADEFRWLIDCCGKDVIDAVNRNGETPLHWAASCGNVSVVPVLVELGADIDCPPANGSSALHRACMSLDDSGPFVELLLALGADVGIVDCDGLTACHLAVECQQSGSLCALVATGCDLDLPDNDGKTPRGMAVAFDCTLPTLDEIDAARRRIAKTRLDLVRERAFQICVGLQPLNIDALQLCEIMMHSFGALGSLILFHQWWTIATKVKHFHKQ